MKDPAFSSPSANETEGLGDVTRRPVAAVDLGTNNCRLLVARVDGDGLTVVDSFSRIVRLGEGLERTGRLDEASIQRTIHALRICARIMARHQVAEARCVATEACRRAVNGEGFVARARLASGLALEILDQEEEARLGLLGCLALADRCFEQFLMMDVGGGSTELAWFRPERGRTEIVNLSVPVGVVTLAERFGSDPDDAGYAAMQDTLLRALDAHPAVRRIDAEMGACRGLQAIGTSGTVTTLAALYLHLARYDRRQVDGLWLPPGALSDVAAELRARDTAARARDPCIGAGRADLVVAGAAIVQALYTRFPFTALRVADRGLREGILASLMGERLDTALTRQLGPPSGASVA
ncbi:MAG: Ppx/GppA family phosphatase [Alphaproteobacteria bacterium]|jgi:exopolyphosphatase/guanosine-5'-triphosphate,3'-diphosphate pyrophosphatase|nr:Ppx/GppA family phosphatase [Alphaproteobacteria bacterium]